MDLTRRAFVKTTAVALASAAAAGSLASLVGCSSGPGTSGEGQKYSAVCRFCGCGCGVICEAKNGKLVSVTGDPDNESSKGLNCVKGYYLGKILYGDDRLTKPLVRDDKSTKGTEQGLREVTWDEALDLVASKLKDAWKADKSKIAFWGSGQQPITEGYCTAKFWKAGLLSNNIDPNARLCMASSVVAFVNVFQTDEPAGCYADLDQADVFVTWGANMAEAHPVLYSRLTAHKLSDANVKHYDLGTLRTRTSVSADKVMLFQPNTDLAIANCIANYLVQNKKYNEAFVKDHLQFKQGTENIGNSFDDGYDNSPIGKSADKVEPITFDEYAARLAPYTFEYTSQLSGVAVEDLKALAAEFADPQKKIVSLWTMGVNQHNRGTWMNHNIYNIHLLSGKIARPGNGPFSLTGQPSACGTAREVGVFSHRLPADLVVNNAQHRRYTEAIWDLPDKYLDAIQKPGFHTVKIFRELSKGNIDFLWTAHNNWAASMPNLTRFLGEGDQKGVFDAFIVVNEVYPTPSCEYADVVLPAAMWVEREGQFGNAERRTAVFEKAVDPPGDAKWDMWIIMEVARRVLDGEQIGGKDAFDHLFGFMYDTDAADFKADQRETNRLIWEEYRIFSNPDMNDRAKAINDDASGTFKAKLKMEAKQLAPYEEYLNHHGLCWPVRNVDGSWQQTQWRFSAGKQADGFDEVGIAQYGKPGLAENVSFYKSANFKPSVVFRPYEPPAETPDDTYPFYLCTGRLLEHWHTGSMTRRVPELDRALPEALLNINPDDASKLGVKDGDMVQVKSRYGQFDIKASTAGRTEPQKGMLFAPFFAEENRVNMAVEDIYCPLSKEPDYKKTCVSVTKVEGR